MSRSGIWLLGYASKAEAAFRIVAGLALLMVAPVGILVLSSSSLLVV